MRFFVGRWPPQKDGEIGWRGEINLILLDSRVRGNGVGGDGLVGITMTEGFDLALLLMLFSKSGLFTVQSLTPIPACVDFLTFDF